MKKKSVIFKNAYFLKLKPNESKSIQIKSALPNALKKGECIGHTFGPFLSHSYVN